jgi:Probable N6-adenine methyltransferase
MNEQCKFESQVDEWISAELAKPRNWDELLYSLPSIYPGTVWERAGILSLRDRIRFGHNRPLVAQSSFAFRLWAQGRLSTPHPQDSLWWFGDAALMRLCKELGASGCSKALLLGTPTLYHYAQSRGFTRPVLLLDRDASAVVDGRYRAVACDLFTDVEPDEKFDCIVADPPWYPQEIRAFLLAGLRRSHKGTRILISIPSVGTRPGIEREWKQLLCWGRDLGLKLLYCETRGLNYISPLFERNALRAANIEEYPFDWRRGDLAAFEVTRVIEPEGLIEPIQQTYARWNEVSFGRVRIRIRVESYFGWRSPQLHKIVAGDILPSVSRRDRRLGSAAVWTSGNRIFGCEGTLALWKIAEAMSLGECAVSSVARAVVWELDESEKAEIRNAVRELTEVIALEETEIKNWRTRENENVVELPPQRS